MAAHQPRPRARSGYRASMWALVARGVTDGIGILPGARAYAAELAGGPLPRAGSRRAERLIRRALALTLIDQRVPGAAHHRRLALRVRLVGVIALLRGWDVDRPVVQTMIVPLVAGHTADEVRAALALPADPDERAAATDRIPAGELWAVNRWTEARLQSSAADAAPADLALVLAAVELFPARRR